MLAFQSPDGCRVGLSSEPSPTYPILIVLVRYGVRRLRDSFAAAETMSLARSKRARSVQRTRRGQTLSHREVLARLAVLLVRRLHSAVSNQLRTAHHALDGYYGGGSGRDATGTTSGFALAPVAPSGATPPSAE